MNKLIVILILYVAVFAGNAGAADQQALNNRLSYLKDIPEIAWVRIERNNVYIGFKERPPDLNNIVNAAAVHGNRAYGFGVHVWAIEAKYPNWKPGDAPFYCEATARQGKLEGSGCK
ncbi:MAG: hypothetical protein AB1427_00700 [Thermodesulfobacteriota bacterium]